MKQEENVIIDKEKENKESAHQPIFPTSTRPKQSKPRQTLQFGSLPSICLFGSVISIYSSHPSQHLH